jgi:ketosteroid isomerase-like protein
MSAVARGDATAVAALYTEGGQLLPPGGEIVTGKADIEAAWKAVLGTGAIKRTVLNTTTLEKLKRTDSSSR